MSLEVVKIEEILVTETANASLRQVRRIIRYARYEKDVITE